VISIIAILMAVLLPAIQGVRQSAQRFSCQSNLKQIGLAFQLHHEALQAFPSAGWEAWTPPNFESGRAAVGEAQQAGWGFQILPYLEGDAAWQGSGGTTDEQRATRAIATVHSVFFCAARRRPQTVTYSDPLYLEGAN